jgi:hypothetical protein
VAAAVLLHQPDQPRYAVERRTAAQQPLPREIAIC